MAISTKSVIVEYCSTQGGSYTPIAGVHEFSIPKQSIHRIEVTDLSSSMETPIAGLQKIDDCSFKVFHTPTVATALNTLYGTSYWWKIIYSDTTTVAFQGYLSEYEAKGKPNEALVWDAKVTITTIPVVTPGS